MNLNGWVRLWVVASVLIGLIVGAVAFSVQPSITAVYNTWCSDGVVVLVPALEKVERTSIDRFALEKSLRENGAMICTKRLLTVQSKRVNATVSDTIAPVNEKYLRKEAEFPSIVLNHWLVYIALWLSACVMLGITGWTVAWVRRGFSQAAA